MVSIRGAICIEENTKECILKNSKILLEKILIENNIHQDEIISIIFSATKDITAAYPAPAARELGITQASLLCVQEMYVEGSLKMCLRVSMNVENDSCQKEVKHVYLNGAQVLRPDLNKG